MKKNISCKLIRLLAIGLFALMCFQANAQSNRTTQEVDGEKFYIHEVEAGHTLYAISKLYQVEIEEIQDQNPQLKDGLKVGQVLKIKVPDDARADRWENPIRIENGFLIHKVKRRETLFGISQEYGIEVNDLLELNPSLNEGLKKNEEIRIPKGSVSQPAVPMAQVPAEKDSLVHHKVKPQETLYAISKKYGVTIEAIKEVNNGLPEGLKAESTIRIPKLKNETPGNAVTDKPADREQRVQTQISERDVPSRNQRFDTNKELQFSEIVSDTVTAFPDRFKVGILMPFYLNYLDSEKTAVPRKVQRLQEIAMSFYRGASMSADSLKNWGLNADLVVVDVNDQLNQITPRLQKDLPDADLVIGPLQRDAIEIVTDFYSGSNAHQVIPVPQPNKILLQRENMTELVPSEITEMRIMAREVAAHHQKDNIILVRAGGIRYKDMFDAFKAELEAAISRDTIYEIGEVKILEISEKSAEGLEEKLNSVRTNVVVVPCNDKAVIADLIRRMGGVSRKDYEFAMYGTSEWINFNFFDIETRNKLNLHLPSNSMIDYESEEVLSFVRSYREKYNTEPDQYAFLGYDIFQYFGMKMLRYGARFPNYLTNFTDEDLLSTQFDFAKTGIESGFENQFVYILEYEDNQFKKEEYWSTEKR
ncbi:PBP1 and LysM peptidoglycan-binding domain-containing protein [Halocola ammonii]